MNVREETDEEVASSSEKSPFSPIAASIATSTPTNEGLASPTVASAAQQHFFRVSSMYKEVWNWTRAPSVKRI